MRLISTLSICICIIVIFGGCEATSTCGDENATPSGWRGHRDTLGLEMLFDTISVDLRSVFSEMSAPRPTIRVFHDPLLTDSIRFELELQTFTNTYSIVNTLMQPIWSGDSLLLNLDYSGRSGAPPPAQISSGAKKRNVMEPQCSPEQPRTNIIAANIFIPVGKKATYIGR